MFISLQFLKRSSKISGQGSHGILLVVSYY